MAHFDLTGCETPRHSTVGSFLANLPEFLGAMAADLRTIVAIAEFEDHRYLQFWADEDSSVIAEVISNLNVSGDTMPLTEDDEQELRNLGFSEPSEGPNPNWRVEVTGIDDLPRLVSMTCTAVMQVLGERSQNLVDIRTWEFLRPHDFTRDEARGNGRQYKHSGKLRTDRRSEDERISLKSGEG